MRIKFLSNNGDSRVEAFRKLIDKKFPQLLSEENPELYLVAGGDGAMLHAIQETIDDGIPYLGKAMGTFNFLMNRFEDDELLISKLLAGELSFDTFESNAIVASLNGKKIGEAVNDVILGNKILDYYSFSISSQSGDFTDFDFKGSGLCISTPIGSTAFNYNNNGRILPINADFLSITGVVSNRFLNDIVPFEKISIKSNGSNIYLTNVDAGILKEGDELILEKGTRIKIAFLDKKDFLKRRIEIGHRYRK